MDQQQSKGTMVFFSIDALGHIHPILSIVKELRRRNYRAIILTMRPLSIAPKLQASGYELQCCQNASEQKDSSDQNKEDKVRDAVKSQMAIFRRGPKEAFRATYHVEGAVGRYFDDIVANSSLIEAKLRSLKPDLILIDHVIGIPFVANIARVWVRLYSGFPSVLYSCYNENCVAGLGLKPDEVTEEWRQFVIDTKHTLRERIRLHWKERGIQDWPLELDLAPTSPYLNFYLGPDELGLHHEPSLKPLPDCWFRLEHTIEEGENGGFSVPEKLEKCPGKLIYFSLGTLVTSDSDLINRLLGMFSKSPNKFIVSMGSNMDKVKLYPNMWGDKFVDQKAILPMVDLFITHGGHNSIIEAFYYGVPGLIAMPIFADQFDSAQRLQDCGFGIRLDPFSCTEGELLTSIDSLLLNEELKQRMEIIGRRLQSIKYHEIAADKLEGLLSLES